MQFSADQDAQKLIKFIQYKSMNFRLGQVKWIWSKWTEYLDELKKLLQPDLAFPLYSRLLTFIISIGMLK